MTVYTGIEARALLLAGTLPAGAIVTGSVYLNHTEVTVLPDDMAINGDLDLRKSAVTVLPDGLTVGQDLLIAGTGITTVPKGLKVFGHLELYGAPVTLPTAWYRRVDNMWRTLAHDEHYTLEQSENGAIKLGRVHFGSAARALVGLREWSDARAKMFAAAIKANPL